MNVIFRNAKGEEFQAEVKADLGGGHYNLLVDGENHEGEKPHMVMNVPYWKKKDLKVGKGPNGKRVTTEIEVEVSPGWRNP